MRSFRRIFPILLIALCSAVFVFINLFSLSLLRNRLVDHPTFVSPSFTYPKPNVQHQDVIVTKHTNTNTTTRILYFAGPPKTGSSSIQTNLYDWSTKGLLVEQNWTWIIPNKTCLAESKCPQHFVQSNTKDWVCLSPCWQRRHFVEEERGKINECLNLSSCYQSELLRVLSQSETQKAVFGSESFANAVTTYKVIQSKEEVTFVVTYRAPKIDHLTSRWKQYRGITNQSSSFRDFLLGQFNFLPSQDPLYAAKVLAIDYGIKVVLLDLSGIIRKGYDVSNVAACQILELPCHLENMTLNLGGKVVLPTVVNVRKDDPVLNDLTLEEKSKIDSILQMLDCNSIHFLFDHPHVQILHPHALIETRNACGREVNYSHSEALQDIRRVVRG